MASVSNFSLPHTAICTSSESFLISAPLLKASWTRMYKRALQVQEFAGMNNLDLPELAWEIMEEINKE
jgi:hypothetical protein